MQIVNFLILLWGVNKLLITPLSAFLEKRSQKIKSDLDQAESGREEVVRLVDEQKALLQKARVEAKEIRENTENAVKKEREFLLQNTKKESEVLIDNAKREIDLDFARAKKQLISEVGSMVVSLSETVLREKLEKNERETLVDEGIKKLQVS